jgi:hypothetical protein
MCGWLCPYKTFAVYTDDGNVSTGRSKYIITQVLVKFFGSNEWILDSNASSSIWWSNNAIVLYWQTKGTISRCLNHIEQRKLENKFNLTSPQWRTYCWRSVLQFHLQINDVTFLGILHIVRRQWRRRTSFQVLRCFAHFYEIKYVIWVLRIYLGPVV